MTGAEPSAPSPQRIRVELHSHTRHSRDCLLSPAAIIAACQRRGIGALAVTDHNEIEGAFELQRLAPFPVIVGEEVFTEQGEIIGLFLREYIPRGLPVHETVARIKAQGGLVYVPHPFDSYRQGAVGRETLDAIRADVDLLEVFNARNLRAEDDEKAYAYAWEHGLTMAAGSDAHSVGEFGNAYLEMEPFDGPQDFLVKARRGRLRVRRSTGLVHLLSSYAKLHKQAAGRMGLAR